MVLIFHCLTPHIVKFPVQRRCRSSIAGFYAFTVQKSTARSSAKLLFLMLLFLMRALLYVLPLYITCFNYV